MYFPSRVEAGQTLAEQLEHFKNEPTAIVALSDGAIVVAAQIAAVLHCIITLLLMEPIKLPGEPEPIGAINQDGGFTYNKIYSPGQIDEFNLEYFEYIEQAKITSLSRIHHLLGSKGLIHKDLLKKHNIILVSDGMSSGFGVDSALDYLKPIKYKKLIVATPIASVAAVDRMHVLSDEIHCLSVISNYMTTNHYYDDNALPSHETIVKTIQNIVEHWR